MIKTQAQRNRGPVFTHNSGAFRLVHLLVLSLLVLSSVAHASSEKLSIVNVTASSSEASNGPANTLDHDFNTRWSAEGYGEWIQYDLKTLSAVDKIKIAWYKGNQRTADFEVETSQDGVNWEYVYYGTSSGTSTRLQTYTFAATPARHVRIVGYANSENEWNSITEVKLFGTPLPTPPRATIVDVTSSSAQHPNIADNTVDHDFGTRWSAQGDGQWIQYELDQTRAVSDVRIAWYKGDKRQAYFNIALSQDGLNWTEVFHGQSTGLTTSRESYVFIAGPARYVRITGWGNSDNLWNSITEVKIRGRKVNLNPVAVDHVIANTAEASNPAGHAVDGNLGTRWSGLGYNATIQFELEELTRVSQVSIAWYKGDKRQADFEVLASENGIDWTYLFYGTSSGSTTHLEPYPFQETAARYIRILGYGNTLNNWNSITEVEIYTMVD